MDRNFCLPNVSVVFTEVTANVVGSLSITIGTLGLIGNLLVFIAIALSKKLQTITNVFVVNLAVSDFLTALILPLQGVGVLSGSKWPLPNWTCTFVAFITLLSNPSSILTLAAIAINRYILITKSKRLYLKIFTFRNNLLILVFIWVLSFLVSVFPNLMKATGDIGHDPCFRVCIWDLQHKKAFNAQTALAVLFFLCSAILFFCYFQIFRFVRSHVNNSQTRLRASMAPSTLDIHTQVTSTISSTTSMGVPTIKQINITKNMAWVVVVFFVCTLPYSYYLLIVKYSIEAAFLILLVALPVCLNPLIYAAKHPVFKVIFKCMFTCNFKKIPERTECIKIRKCGNCF